MIATRGRAWAAMAAAALAATVVMAVRGGAAREAAVIAVPDVAYRLPDPPRHAWTPADDAANHRDPDRINDELIFRDR